MFFFNLLHWLRSRKIDFRKELHATQPDYVVFTPKTYKKIKPTDTGNEHFLVFEAFNKQVNKGLMAVWTQSSQEGSNDQRIVFSKSTDQGETWAEPKVIAGQEPSEKGNMASWGFPMVSKSGRIYVLYNQHIGIYDTFFHTTGVLKGIFSDDGGARWSEPEPIPMPRSIYDNPDKNYPTNIIIWQKPLRLSEDKYYCGFTRWVSKAVRHPSPRKHWSAIESVVEFMRFNNLDEDPSPSEFDISYISSNEDALKVGHVEDKDISVVQEPSIVKLPDERLFCVMRTTRGSPYYSISNQGADKWADPKPLKYNDDSEPLKHPLSPCPIFQYEKDKYFILFHNHDGNYKDFGPLDTQKHRRPIYLAKGVYSKKTKQPITFSEPEFLMDHTGKGLGISDRHDLAMYCSFTQMNGNNILWYPDRKFFLLGKILPL